MRLNEYEALCRQCLELKQRSATGEGVSRDEAQYLLNEFVAANRSLKANEKSMTVVQRQRFEAIGRWFSTGQPPKEPEQVVLQMALMPVEMLTGTPASPLTSRSVMLPEKVKGKIYALADVSVPDFSYGIMGGYQCRKIGGYLRFRSDFHKLPSVSYECMSDGSLPEGGKIWPSGSTARNNLSVTAGLLVPVRHDLTVYAGVIFSWRRLALHAGITTIKFKTAAFTCRVCVRL